MDADKFLEIVQGGGGDKSTRLAIVKSTPSSGKITVQFETDEATSTGGFAHLASYSSPQVNDRAVMLKVGNTYVAIGKLST